MQAPEIDVSDTTGLFQLQHEKFYAEDKIIAFVGKYLFGN